MPPPKVCCYCGDMYEDALYRDDRRGNYIFYVHWECYERTAPVPCPVCEERMSRFMAGVLCRVGYYCTWCTRYFQPRGYALQQYIPTMSEKTWQNRDAVHSTP